MPRQEDFNLNISTNFDAGNSANQAQNLSKVFDDMGRTAANAADGSQNLTNSLGNLGNNTSQTTQNVDSVSNSFANLERATMDVSRSIEKNVGRSTQRVFIETKKTTLAFRALNKTMRLTARTASFVGKTLVEGVVKSLVLNSAKNAALLVSSNKLKQGFDDLDASTERLGNTFNLSSDLSDSLRNSIQDLSVRTLETQKTIAETIDTFAAFGLSASDSLQATTQAFNVSRATGREFSEVVGDLSATFNGSLEAAQNLGVNIRGMSEESLKAGSAVQDLNRQYGSFLNRFGDSEQVFSDLGGNLLGFFVDLAGLIGFNTPKIQAFNELVQVLNQSFIELRIVIRQISEGTGENFRFLSRIISGTFDDISEGISKNLGLAERDVEFFVKSIEAIFSLFLIRLTKRITASLALLLPGGPIIKGLGIIAGLSLGLNSAFATGDAFRAARGPRGDETGSGEGGGTSGEPTESPEEKKQREELERLRKEVERLKESNAGSIESASNALEVDIARSAEDLKQVQLDTSEEQRRLQEEANRSLYDISSAQENISDIDKDRNEFVKETNDLIRELKEAQDEVVEGTVEGVEASKVLAESIKEIEKTTRDTGDANVQLLTAIDDATRQDVASELRKISNIDTQILDLEEEKTQAELASAEAIKSLREESIERLDEIAKNSDLTPEAIEKLIDSEEKFLAEQIAEIEKNGELTKLGFESQIDELQRNRESFEDNIDRSIEITKNQTDAILEDERAILDEQKAQREAAEEIAKEAQEANKEAIKIREAAEKAAEEAEEAKEEQEKTTAAVEMGNQELKKANDIAAEQAKSGQSAESILTEHLVAGATTLRRINDTLGPSAGNRIIGRLEKLGFAVNRANSSVRQVREAVSDQSKRLARILKEANERAGKTISQGLTQTSQQLTLTTNNLRGSRGISLTDVYGEMQLIRQGIVDFGGGARSSQRRTPDNTQLEESIEESNEEIARILKDDAERRRKTEEERKRDDARRRQEGGNALTASESEKIIGDAELAIVNEQARLAQKIEDLARRNGVSFDEAIGLLSKEELRRHKETLQALNDQIAIARRPRDVDDPAERALLAVESELAKARRDGTADGAKIESLERRAEALRRAIQGAVPEISALKEAVEERRRAEQAREEAAATARATERALKASEARAARNLAKERARIQATLERTQRDLDRRISAARAQISTLQASISRQIELDELRPDRDDEISARDAFNPFRDPTARRRRQPVQLQIQIGDRRLADILFDLQESGLVNNVVAA